MHHSGNMFIGPLHHIVFFGLVRLRHAGHKFPPNLMFMLYGMAFISFAASVLHTLSFKTNRWLDIYNKQGYIIYLYQNVGFLIASRSFQKLFEYYDNWCAKAIVAACTLAFLFVFHAMLAVAIHKVSARLKRHKP